MINKIYKNIDVRVVISHIFFKYSKKLILFESDIKIFVGFPTINIIDAVFAALNSIIRYGIGFILERFVKYIINGVNVRIIISFDVNIVTKHIKINKIVNNLYWLFLQIFVDLYARKLKNPKLSHTIERNVIEKNKTSIFIGDIKGLLNSELYISLNVICLNIIIVIAPMAAII